MSEHVSFEHVFRKIAGRPSRFGSKTRLSPADLLASRKRKMTRGRLYSMHELGRLWEIEPEFARQYVNRHSKVFELRRASRLYARLK